MDCMLFTFEKSSSHALGGVRNMAYFIITDEQLQLNRGCFFLVQAMYPESFLFHQFIYTFTIWRYNKTCHTYYTRRGSIWQLLMVPCILCPVCYLCCRRSWGHRNRPLKTMHTVIGIKLRKAVLKAIMDERGYFLVLFKSLYNKVRLKGTRFERTPGYKELIYIPQSLARN